MWLVATLLAACGGDPPPDHPDAAIATDGSPAGAVHRWEPIATSTYVDGARTWTVTLTRLSEGAPSSARPLGTGLLNRCRATWSWGLEETPPGRERSDGLAWGPVRCKRAHHRPRAGTRLLSSAHERGFHSMHSFRLVLVSSMLSSLLFSAACKKDEATKPAEPTKAVEPLAKAVEPTPSEPVAPVAPTYSPEVSAKLLGDLEACEYSTSCDAYKPLVGFGARVAPDLTKLAVDATKPAKARGVAAEALAEIKDPVGGPGLLEAAKKEADFMLRRALFAAAGASGNEAVLASAGTYLLTEAGWEQRGEVEAAITPFGKKAFDWAVGAMGKAKSSYQVALADVIAETAQAGDLPTLQGLIAKSKDVMVKNHLAAKAIALGDSAQFAVLIAGLASKDEYDRADAGNMLAKVADKLPADQKATTIELLKAAKGKDKGGMTSAGYDEALRALGGS